MFFSIPTCEHQGREELDYVLSGSKSSFWCRLPASIKKWKKQNKEKLNFRLKVNCSWHEFSLCNCEKYDESGFTQTRLMLYSKWVQLWRSGCCRCCLGGCVGVVCASASILWLFPQKHSTTSSSYILAKSSKQNGNKETQMNKHLPAPPPPSLQN